jgi:hypothetical protein
LKGRGFSPTENELSECGLAAEVLKTVFAQHKSKWLGLTVAPLGILTGCHAKPDRVVTLRSPNSPIYYTVETSYGHGAVSNDYTDVYAHYEHGKYSDRQLALNGPYLENTAIRWNSPTDVDFCIGNGMTIEFRNRITLSTEDLSSVEVHQQLNETC